VTGVWVVILQGVVSGLERGGSEEDSTAGTRKSGGASWCRIGFFLLQLGRQRADGERRARIYSNGPFNGF
jgi:hypothetical protein